MMGEMDQLALEERMELWTDDNLSEFAIRFKSVVVVKTSNNAKLVKMIDEALYKEGFDFDWHYILSQWVICYLLSKYATMLNAGTEKREKEFLANTESDKASTIFYRYIRDWKPKPKYKSDPRAGLKCHYCNLKYHLEEERKDHEEFWRHNELIRS
ncbi:MAG TPA: hypothetical protein VF884_15570 [Nitrososphaeraceae archaeon]